MFVTPILGWLDLNPQGLGLTLHRMAGSFSFLGSGYFHRELQECSGDLCDGEGAQIGKPNSINPGFFTAPELKHYSYMSKAILSCCVENQIMTCILKDHNPGTIHLYSPCSKSCP